MNTIGENLINKKTAEEVYTKLICPECNNRNNKEDLCKITRRLDNTVKCDNYERCMTTKCNTCSRSIYCFKEKK